MKIERKIVLLWTSYLLLSFASLLLPHRPFPWISKVNLALQVLIGIICIFIVLQEKQRTKPIFIHFAAFFIFAIALQVNFFVGVMIRPNDELVTIYYHQYINKIGYPFLLIFSVSYVAIDYICRNFRVWHKYVTTWAIVLVVFVPLYFPYISNPLHLYKNAEYAQYMRWSAAKEGATNELKREPSDEELISYALTTQRQPDVNLSSASMKADLERFKPYLEGANATILFWKPLEVNVLLVNLFCVVLIGIVFLMKYLRDYPHAAYLEKILQTFLILCMFEILHSWSYTQSPSYEIYRSILEVGQYLTIGVLLALVYVFSMRLRFVLTALGKYYEEMIVEHPDQVTRWRDEIDNAVLQHFFARSMFRGRLASLQSSQVHVTNKQESQS